MKKFLQISIISIFTFSIIDFFFGNTILEYLYKNQIILSEIEKRKKLQKIRLEEKKYRISNDFYHHTLKKNVEADSTWGNNKYTTCTDRYGFRIECGKNIDSNKKIILIGDSFTEGIGLNYNETFAGMFSKKMNYKVYNMAVSSYSPIIYRNKIKYFLDNSLEAKHVLIFIDISDIDDESNYYFQCGKNICEKNISENNKNNEQEIKYKTFFPIIDLFKIRIKSIKRSIKPEVYIYRKDFLRSNWTFIDENKNISIGIKNSVKHMNEIYEYLREKDITLSVAVYPHPGQLLHDNEDSKQVKIWNNFCIQKCKYFINYFPEFFEEVKLSSPKKIIKKYYIKDDIHFNFKGNKKIFDKLKNYNF